MTKQLQVISLKHFHCQQWILQQEYLIACKRISYSDKCGTHLDAQEEWALPCHPCTRLPLAFEFHTHASEGTREPLCIHWQIWEI